jgi:hypothetical protein
MASASGDNTDTSQELVIFEPTTEDLVYAGEEVNHSSATACNYPTWITQLFSRLQKADKYVRLLAEAREEEDAMEIDISEICCY